MRKIGFVINYVVKNGPSSVILNIIKNLDREKIEPSVITLFEGNDQEVIHYLETCNVKVHQCKTLSRMKCICGINKEFDKIIETEKYDVLHTHGFIPDILSARIKLPINKISTIHNNMFEDYLDVYGKLKSKVFIKMHLCALQKIDKSICCSKSVYDVMKKYIENISYICNGIECREVQKTITRRELNIPENARVFLYSGVLNTRKNIVWLIQNFVKYHNNEEYLIVLGSGALEKECFDCSDENVMMLGFQQNPLEFMSLSDIYISASKSEGFSMSVLEALSQGLGLLLSDIPSHREVFEISKSLYLGELFSENDFESALKKLRGNNLDKEKIKIFQKQKLSASSMTKKYQKNYI